MLRFAFISFVVIAWLYSAQGCATCGGHGQQINGEYEEDFDEQFNGNGIGTSIPGVGRKFVLDSKNTEILINGAEVNVNDGNLGGNTIFLPSQGGVGEGLTLNTKDGSGLNIKSRGLQLNLNANAGGGLGILLGGLGLGAGLNLSIGQEGVGLGLNLNGNANNGKGNSVLGGGVNIGANLGGAGGGLNLNANVDAALNVGPKAGAKQPIGVKI